MKFVHFSMYCVNCGTPIDIFYDQDDYFDKDGKKIKRKCLRHICPHCKTSLMVSTFNPSNNDEFSISAKKEGHYKNI